MLALSRIHAFQPLTRQDDKLQVTCFQVVVDQNPTALQLGFSHRLVSVPGLSRCLGKRARQRPIQASLRNPTAWIRLSIVAFTSARTQILQATEQLKYKSGEPLALYKNLVLHTLLFAVCVVFWPLFLLTGFGKSRIFSASVRETLALEKKVSPVRIVHVDDENFLLKMVEVVIRTKFNNVAIQSFHDSNEAWQELSQTDPDILITDDKMPGLTGEGLVRRLVERKAQYPIIVTSGWPPTEDWVRRCGDMNLNISLLRCPFTFEQLYKQLN